MLRQVRQVDPAAALSSTANMKNFSQRSCFPSARLLPWSLHLFQCSSFSSMASSQLVSYNLTLFRLQCLHQAAVRLHQRVKVTTLSCFSGLPQCRSPDHNLSRSRRASAAPEQRALHLSRRHYRNVEKSLLQYWPALMKGRWVFDSHYWQICVDIYFAVTITHRFYRSQCAACYKRL